MKIQDLQEYSERKIWTREWRKNVDKDNTKRKSSVSCLFSM